MSIDYEKLKLIFFDLDLTLAESKSPISNDMADLLKKLLNEYYVCVISGGKFEQFQTQLVANLNLTETELKKLHLMPTQGAFYYRYVENSWEEVYSNNFSIEEKTRIINALKKLVSEEKMLQVETFGEQIEDRGGQITFSTLGQKAPSELKHKWDNDKNKRLYLREKLKKDLPELKISIGGSTSIDITPSYLDKSYGVTKLNEILKLNIDECIYIGDDLEPGGNDFEVIKTGIQTIKTMGPENTKSIILNILKKTNFSV